MKTPLKYREENNPGLRNFSDAVNPFTSNRTDAFNQLFPAFNITEDNGCYCIDVIAPGYKKEGFRVNIEGNTMTIKLMQPVNDRQTDKFECCNNTFFFSFPLPDNILENLVTAVFIDGLLKLNIPKHVQ